MKQAHLNKKDITIQGKSQDSIKFTLNGVACVMFKCKDIIEQIQEDDEVCLNFVGRANLNTWMGRTSAQLIIDDIEVIKDNVMEF